MPVFWHLVGGETSGLPWIPRLLLTSLTIHCRYNRCTVNPLYFFFLKMDGIKLLLLLLLLLSLLLVIIIIIIILVTWKIHVYMTSRFSWNNNHVVVFTCT